MRLRPRPGSTLADGLRQALHALLFTLGVTLVVGWSALLIRATLAVTRPYTGSAATSSLLALVVFAAGIAVPTYVLATRDGDEPNHGERTQREKF